MRSRWRWLTRAPHIYNEAMRRVANGREYGISPPGFQLPYDTRLGLVRLQVSDLERSIAYYDRVLGFLQTAHDRQSASLGASGGGSSAPLLELRERAGAKPVPRNGVLGLYHVAILLPDRASLGRFVAHLTLAGVPFAAADHLVSEAIYLWDPDGLGLEVYADRPRQAWRSHGRELLMATERLDQRALLDAGEGKPWCGMPAGTIVGHIHLSVGDLREARRFYHDALGFDITVWSYPGALFLSAGGYHHHVATNTWAPGARPAGEDDARLIDWELLLPHEAEVEAALESVRAAGYTTTDDRVIDPWEIPLRLSVRRSRATA